MYSLETVVNNWVTGYGRQVRNLMAAKSQEYHRNGLAGYDLSQRTLSEMKLDEIIQHIVLPYSFDERTVMVYNRNFPTTSFRHIFARNNRNEIIDIIPGYLIYPDSPNVKVGMRAARVRQLLPLNYYELDGLLVAYGERGLMQRTLKIAYN